MQKIFKVFKKIILVLAPFYLISCSSSSYYERYGNHTNSNPFIKPSVVEDEINDPQITVTNLEAESILDKLSRVSESNTKKERFLQEIISYLNTPYRYGGTTRMGIDCSAFTQKVYGNSMNIILPRTAREQYKEWQPFKDREQLKFGDLIYFNTSRRYYPGHVGIYLDDNLFAHASSSSGVIISSLENEYYETKFIGANRVKIKKY
jgi:cell wall-associated NlpC family hydrolase